MINQQNRSSSELKGTSIFLGSLWDLRKKKKTEEKNKTWKRKKTKKVKTLNPPKIYVLLGNCMFKKCNQEKAELVTQSLLSLLHRQ